MDDNTNIKNVKRSFVDVNRTVKTYEWQNNPLYLLVLQKHIKKINGKHQLKPNLLKKRNNNNKNLAHCNKLYSILNLLLGL